MEKGFCGVGGARFLGSAAPPSDERKFKTISAILSIFLFLDVSVLV